MKWLGCCTLCDREVFDVTRRYAKGPLAGRPRQVGAPLEGAKRIWLVFVSGKHGPVTLCGDCEVTPETLPEIHHQMRRAWAAEGHNDHREVAGGKPLDLAQQWKMGALQLRQLDDVPLGILCTETWAEAMEREAQHGRAG